MSKCKAPYSEDFLPTVLVKISYAFARPFRCDLHSILSNLKKEKMREPWTYQFQPFGCVLLDVFCSCVWDFYNRFKRVATWSTRCAL